MTNQNLTKKKWISSPAFLLMLFLSLSSGLLFAQQKIITGKVQDEHNNPLESVSVTIKGNPNAGTTTDANGNFSIGASANAVIVFEFIGYQKEEVNLKGNSNLNVVLHLSDTKLNEVVVIGYGTKLKGELTGAVSKVDSKAFEARPLTNTMNALQGALPGVTITRGSGRPGFENYSAQIRGASSVNGNSVLVLIDGIPGDLSLINPNDIADLTVLKDAAASIYGARAADGVIIVTTKRGKKGAPSVSYSGNYGIKTPQFLKERTNTLHLAEMYDEGMRNVNLPGVSEEVFEKIRNNAEPDPTGWLKYLENFPGFYQSHDWNDAVYGPGAQQTHNLSISGGGDKNSYLFSAGYERNEGVFRHGENHSSRYNLRMNYDFKISDRINIETSTSFENQPITTPTALSSILYYVNQMGSYVPLYNPLGQLYKYQGGFRNAVQYLEEGGLNKENAYRVSTNVKGNIKLLNDLLLVGQAGIIIDFNDRKETRPTFAQHNWDGSDFDIVNNPNSALFTNYKNIYQNYTAYLDYNKTLAGKHKLNVMAGASREGKTYQNQSITGYNFASNEIFTLNLADRTKTEYANFSGGASDWALQSYFGRLSYSFDKKYLIDFTTRMDGSSKFSESKRWSALFPSVAVAWNLSEENFIRSLNVFDNLKARLSWGQSGNQELSFGNYDYISLISISGAYPLGSPNVGLPGAVSSIASQDRTWETIETKNAGIDFALLNSRLTGSFDYYIKNNRNMLVNDQLPATLGGSAPTQNIGKLETKGWDFSIGWRDKIGGVSYSVSAMLSDSKNKLIELKGNDAYGEGLIYARKGYSLNSYFGYQFDGIIQNEEQLTAYKQLGNVPSNLGVGDVMFRDVDGDGQITAFGDASKGTSGDMVYLGNLRPRYTYSSNISVSYKGFDLSIFLQGIGKRQGIRTGEISVPLWQVWMQPLEYFYGKNWTPENPDAKYPRIIPGSVGFDGIRNWNWRYSSMRMNNLAYLRLKVVTLAYNLPQYLVSKAKVKNIRIYVSGQDLFTFSKDTWNKSFDPEETWERSDEQTYPFNSVISFGLDIKF
jgi:TonB-linked SusC/RagA family outer membrane protein